MPQTSSDTEKRVFLIHLAVYLIVNALLAIINLNQTPDEGQPRELWFFWPLAGWGMGVAIHALAMLFGRKVKDGDLFAGKDVQGFVVHLFIYMAVNTLLIAINLSATSESLWFYWPLLGWGIAIAVHALFTYVTVTRRSERRSLSEAKCRATKRRASSRKSPATKQPASKSPAKKLAARRIAMQTS
jgi:hypothetical protein